MKQKYGVGGRVVEDVGVAVGRQGGRGKKAAEVRKTERTKQKYGWGEECGGSSSRRRGGKGK